MLSDSIQSTPCIFWPPTWNGASACSVKRGGGHVVLRYGARERVTLLKGSTQYTHVYVENGRDLRIDTCNDRCPVCDAEIEPYDWDDISVIVSKSSDRWIVAVSPPQAEDAPKYVERCFDRKSDAEKFARSEAERLERESDGASVL